jgi:HEAT repeat protein
MKQRLWIVLGLLLVGGLWAARSFLPGGPSARPRKAADPVPGQLDRLRSPQVEERRAAALALALTRPDRADQTVAPLLESLSDPDCEVRSLAVAALAEAAPLDSVREAARGTDPDRRRLALLTLGKMGRKARPATTEVLAALQDADPRTQLAAALALKRLAPEKIDLPAGLRTQDTFAGQWARIVLQDQVSPEFRAVVRTLAAGLSDPELLMRDWSAAALAELASRLPAVREARAPLQTAFRDPAAGSSAAAALARLALADQTTADFLVAGLADPDLAIRRQSALALNSMVTRDGSAVVTLRNPATVEALRHLLDDHDEMLQLSAVSTLGNIGPPASPALPAILRLLDNGGPRVTAVVVSALGRIGAEPGLVIPPLLRILVGPDAPLRESAGAALSRIGKEATPASPGCTWVHELVASLTASDVRVRRGAALALGALGVPVREAVGPLSKALADPDQGVRMEVARALWRLDPLRADALVPVLTAALADPDLQVPRSAAATLEEMGPAAVAAVPALRQALEAKDVLLHEAVARALGRIGPLAAAAVPDLVGLAKRDRAAVLALGAMGPAAREAIPELLELLKTRSDLPAALALAALDSSRKEGLPVLRAQIGSANLRDRIDTWVALARLGPAAAEAAPQLLEREYEGMQVLLPFVLAQIGPDAVPALTKALSHPRLRGPACEALADLGPAAREAVPALVPLLKDGTVQVQALRALAAIGPPAVAVLREAPANPGLSPEALAILEGRPITLQFIEALAHQVREGPAAVRVAACRVLRSAGPEAREALPTLRSLLEVEDPVVRVAVAQAIAVIDPSDRASLPVLLEVLAGKDGPGRLPAARAVGTLGERGRLALPELKAACRDRDPELRAAALAALGEVSSDSGMPILIEGLNDPQEAVRRAAVRALGTMGPKAAEAVLGLTRLVEDERLGAREDAIVALGRIGPAARAALPALRESLRVPNGRVEWVAPQRPIHVAEALWRIDRENKGIGREVVILLQPSLLEEAVVAPDRAALDVLAEMGHEAAPAVPALCCKLVSANPEVRRRAIEVLGGIGVAARAAVPLLENAAGDRDETIRRVARAAVAKITR